MKYKYTRKELAEYLQNLTDANMFFSTEKAVVGFTDDLLAKLDMGKGVSKPERKRKLRPDSTPDTHLKEINKIVLNNVDNMSDKETAMMDVASYKNLYARLNEVIDTLNTLINLHKK